MLLRYFFVCSVIVDEFRAQKEAAETKVKELQDTRNTVLEVSTSAFAPDICLEHSFATCFKAFQLATEQLLRNDCTSCGAEFV